MKHRIDLLGPDAWLLSLPVRLATALVAAVALLLGYLLSLLRPAEPALAALGYFAAWLAISGPVLLGAARGLFHRAPTLNPYYLDQFVALVLLACLADARYATGAIVSIILIFGQLLEERSVRGIREAIAGLSRLSRLSARRLHTQPEGGDREEPADAETLAVGDRLRVLPGELIPADGRLTRGHSAVNQAAITGESLPVDVGPGDTVFAGTLNLSGVIELETTRVATETVIGRVRAILETAPADKPLIARRIDAYLRYYTPAVLMLTAMTWILTQDLGRAVSVLVVCLPCAFVLSGPSVMVAGLAVCARLGILVKTPRHFETATTLDTVVFDKTGTLTRGQLAVAEVTPLGAFTTAAALPLARRLAAASQHPVARAIAAHPLPPLTEADTFPSATTPATSGTTAALTAPGELSDVQDVTEVPGRGLRGRIAGVAVLLGSEAWLLENGLTLTAPPAVASQRTVWLALDGQLALRFALTDTVRPEARTVVAALATAGLDRAVLLTGDHELAAAAVATHVGIPQHRSACLPQEKLDEVRALKRTGRHVLVVGDGVNDAPALAGGDLGIAINHSGGHIAVQTADVALLQDNLLGLVHFVRISHRALQLINQNLLVSTLIIVVALLLSALGLVGPLTAALLHESSAFFVLINSSRLLRYSEEDPEAA